MYQRRFLFLDKESIYRLGLELYTSIDIESSEEIYDPKSNNHIILLKLKKEKYIVCPNCGVVNDSKLRSSVKQLIKHSSALENNITLKLYRRIYKCECGYTFKENNPFTNNKNKLTFYKENKILLALKDINKTFKSIAKEFNVSKTTIINLFDSRVNFPRQKLTEVICVDEVYSKHCGYHKYCFIIYSPQLNKILDVLPSRHQEDLFDYFARIPIEERMSVKYFSMDLYEVYRRVAKIVFPKALICADHFHVIKNLTDFFNSARIRIMKKYEHLKGKNDNWYWLYKKYWKKLLQNPDKLGYKKFRVSRSGLYLDDHQIVDYMLSIDKDLKKGYDLLNEYRNFNSCATIYNAEKMLDELIIKFHNSSLPKFIKGYKLLKNWRTEIINSFNRINGSVISNGGMERANRDIKTIIRIGYGYSNFERLRNRIMYIKNEDATIKYKK